MSEMGGSMRPVFEAVQVVDLRGGQTLRGSTYVTPAVRLAERLRGEKSDGLVDQRYADATVRQYGLSAGYNIGFSTVAEAYLNFGRVGVLVGALALGLLTSAIDRKAKNSARVAAGLGVLLYALLYNVRQPSNVFAFTLVVGWAVILVSSKVTPTRSSPGVGSTFAHSPLDSSRALR
jgi:hypothetical protein